MLRLYFHGCDGVVGDLSRARESLRDDAVVDSLFYVEEGDAFTHGEGSSPILPVLICKRVIIARSTALPPACSGIYVPDAEGGDLSLVGRLPAYAAHELVSVVIPCYYSKNMIGKVVRLTRDELLSLWVTIPSSSSSTTDPMTGPTMRYALCRMRAMTSWASISCETSGQHNASWRLASGCRRYRHGYG